MADDTKLNLIGGEWVAGVGSQPNVNPSDLADVVGVYAQGDSGDVDAAVQAAERALPAWRFGALQQRSDLLDRV
ncbi:MAG: aldehyde dehydrogenase family protein, partial [Proteobacteria bacterium]|nr:aldehyde dehydrogenase family protein [Pseudomonadota bacterium]